MDLTYLVQDCRGLGQEPLRVTAELRVVMLVVLCSSFLLSNSVLNSSRKTAI